MEEIKFVDYDREIEISCWTDAYVYDDYDKAYLLSILGNDSSAKAVSAALVNGRDINVNDEVVLRSAFGENYKIYNSKLSCGALHVIVFAESFINANGNGKLIFVEGNPEEIVINTIMRDYPVPLLQEWRSWLFKKLKESGHIEELKGNIKVLRVDVKEGYLDNLVCEGLKNKEIWF